MVGAEAREARLAWAFVLPALVAITLIAMFPLVWTVWAVASTIFDGQLRA